MGAPLRTSRDAPDPFIGLAYSKDELVKSSYALTGKVKDLRRAMDERQLAATKQASEEIAEIAGQMKAMASHTASVIARLTKRDAGRVRP